MNRLVEIKSGSIMAVAVVVQSLECSVIELALKDLTGGKSDFFENELAIVDVGAVASFDGVDWASVRVAVRKFGLILVGVRNCPRTAAPQVLSVGMVVLDAGVRDTASVASKAVTMPSAAVENVGPLIITVPVRAGQRIYAQGRDLIVTAAVNNGAEVIADGNIHIYGVLRGRALAGASGNQSAMIFAQAMEPELVSIAGIYRTFENGYSENFAKQTAQVRLDGDVISIEPISAT